MNTSSANLPSLRNLQSQTEYELGDTTIIGRHEDCHLVLKSERGASRKHARITVEDHVAILMDLGSLNGTTVNGREISRAVQLIDGDILVFDEQEYLFHAPSASESNNSDNVTVIANKDEVGRPERIKSAIRVVETAPVPPAEASNDSMASTPLSESSSESVGSSVNASLDETESWETPRLNEAAADENEQAQGPSDRYTGNTAIPATSRPGGDAPTPRRLQDRHASSHPQAKSRWSLRLVLVSLLILILLGASYFAYKAGYTAGNTSGTEVESS